MATLALPAPTSADTDAKASLARAIQVVEQLEDAADELHGVGVLSGGVVSIVSGFTCSIASGTKIYQEGYVYELASAQEFTAASPSTTEYVWATVEVTRADPQEPTELDEYALDISTNTTGTAPSALHCCIAVLTNGALAVSSVDNNPAGKYLRSYPNDGHRSLSVAGSANVTLTAAQYRDGIIKLTGLLTGNINVIFPAEAGRRWTVLNGTTGSFTVTCKTSAGSGIAITQGTAAVLYCDGTDIKAAQTDLATAGAAPSNASYLALATNSTLTAERVFTPGTGMTGTDAGAGSTYTLGLNDTAQDAIGGTLNVTAGAEAANAITVTIQARDVANNNLAERRLVRVWLSDTQAAGETAAAPDGGVAVATGTLLQTVTAGKHLVVVSNSSGQAQVTLTESTAKSFWVNAEVDGRISSLQVTFA